MRVTWLGWAGVELRVGDATLVIDPLQDAGAVFAPLEAAAGTPLPTVVPASPGTSVAGLLTHLHRDHADAGALLAALAPGAPVLEPPAGDGDELEELALAQARHELAASGLPRHRHEAWESTSVEPFVVTALPAVDGIGDPQVAWLVEGGGSKVLHLGDTAFHGSWWRMARRHGPFDVVLAPVNGAVLDFPHRRPSSPLPGAMDPEQAAVAVAALGARLAIPIHTDGYAVPGVYRPVPDATARFLAAAEQRQVAATALQVGASLEVPRDV